MLLASRGGRARFRLFRSSPSLARTLRFVIKRTTRNITAREREIFYPVTAFFHGSVNAGVGVRKEYARVSKTFRGLP